MYQDLREFITLVDKLGALRRIEGADPRFELGGITEVAAGFIFNTPRLISAIAPLFAGTLIVGLGGYGKAATIIGMFYVLGLFAVPFLPETNAKPLPEADALLLPQQQVRKPA